MAIDDATYSPLDVASLVRPTIVPLPRTVDTVEQPIRSLNGVWKLNPHPPAEFWSNSVDSSVWPEVTVPGSVDQQGFTIEADQEYAYRYQFMVPTDYAGQRILLRFDGANCAARVWVNGQFIRSHYGGFTSWDCEITDQVSPGAFATLTVGVTHRPREISPFHFGGIIRDVRLIALPPDHLTRLHLETDFDRDYQDAALTIVVHTKFTRHDAATVAFTLRDPRDRPIPLEPRSIDLTKVTPEARLITPIASPMKWDAEHPHLYSLDASVSVGGEVVETLTRRVGFRKIVVNGHRVYVNGREVKLRGVNRHDIYPTTGRAITSELVEKDVRLFRDANINFIRTSHYPPREDFLDACDHLGIYVEEESSVAFVYQSIQPTQNDPDFTAAYVNQFAEMIERDRSHPSVILWSLANECYWGRNFQAQYDYAKQADPSRPVIFSYPITVPEGKKAFDIWSLHYASYNCHAARQADNFSLGQVWGNRAPVLHDEYAHIPCYDHAEQRRDQAVREFWGESIKRFWENIFLTDGALGGAIWAGIDDSVATPNGHRVWEWGIVDGWRREKPEYWLTKKAYSPIRIADQPVAKPEPGEPLEIPIQNWFDHTNLREIAIRWAVGDDSGVITDLDLEPHTDGILTIAPRGWTDGETLRLEFYRSPDLLVDAYALPIGRPRPASPPVPVSAPRLEEAGDFVSIVGADYRITFSRRTGLITSGSYQGTEIIKAGPFVHLVGVRLDPWAARSFQVRVEGFEAIVDSVGSYGAVKARFEIRIDGSGRMLTTYHLDRFPLNSPRARRLRVGMDVGGFREVGIAYTVSSRVDRLQWKRKARWSVYPADHLGRPEGIAQRTRARGEERHGEPPSWPWAEDMREFYLFGMYDIGGRGTRDFRSMKHNIQYASAMIANTSHQLRAESDGSHAVRLEVLDNPEAMVDDRDSRITYQGDWWPVSDDGNNYRGTEMYSNRAGSSAELRFTGQGIGWIGSKDLIHGIAEVYIDGVREPVEIDLHAGLGHGVSRGEEKLHQCVLFSKEGLGDGEHTIRIVVTGRHNPHANNAYVSIDAFVVLSDPSDCEVRFMINNEWNYPELTWGNYVGEPILIPEGYANQVQVRLTGDDHF